MRVLCPHKKIQTYDLNKWSNLKVANVLILGAVDTKAPR